ncbi:MAG: hypothetical protein LBD80_01610 [Tannerella sp.]|jgi:hypothetical protein|nr:hypothetical protein [Tannerella sp.]
MNRTVKFFMTACLAVSLFACKDEEKGEDTPYFGIEANFLTQTFGPDADAQYVTVKTNQIFTATSSAPWCTAELLEGEKVEQLKIKVTESNVVTSRTATVTVACQGYESVNIAIIQNGVAATIAIAPNELDTISNEGGDVTFVVTSNVDEWNYSIAEDVAWLSEKEKTATTLTLTATANREISPRKTSLKIFLPAYPDKEENIDIVQAAAFEPRLNVTPATIPAIARAGGAVTLTIDANAAWKYEIDDNWLTATETATTLTVTAANNTSLGGRMTELTIRLNNYPEFVQSYSIKQSGAADMLDVIFNTDGTANDVSPMTHNIQWMNFDNPLSVAYNAVYGRNVVTFNPASNGGSPGANHGSYYRIDYADNGDFNNKLADGHSFECLVKFNVNYVATTQNYETKFFSTHQSGGTGFLIANQSQGTGPNGITFLPNIPATNGGGSNWIWANSQIKPNGEKYYHLVGVWNQAEGKAYIYVDGELKREANAAGFYRPPSSATYYWIAIGGDAGNNTIEGAFQGNIVVARIYDSPLSAADALALYNEIAPRP